MSSSNAYAAKIGLYTQEEMDEAIQKGYGRGEQCGYDRGFDEGHTIGWSAGYVEAMEKAALLTKELLERLQ